MSYYHNRQSHSLWTFGLHGFCIAPRLLKKHLRYGRRAEADLPEMPHWRLVSRACTWPSRSEAGIDLATGVHSIGRGWRSAIMDLGGKPMPAFPDAEVRASVSHWTGLSPVQYAAVATTLAVLGVSAIWRPMWSLWSMWTTDPLKSIGMAAPLVSVVLILRVWRALGWRAQGTWWGLLPLIASMAMTRIQEQTVLILVVSPHWSTALPPPSLALLAYGAGVVLLLGGTQLFQAALFPIVLLWFANPIPNVFSLAVDLPLQEVSAHIARCNASGTSTDSRPPPPDVHA